MHSYVKKKIAASKPREISRHTETIREAPVHRRRAIREEPRQSTSMSSSNMFPRHEEPPFPRLPYAGTHLTDESAPFRPPPVTEAVTMSGRSSQQRKTAAEDSGDSHDARTDVLTLFRAPVGEQRRSRVTQRAQAHLRSLFMKLGNALVDDLRSRAGQSTPRRAIVA